MKRINLKIFVKFVILFFFVFSFYSVEASSYIKKCHPPSFNFSGHKYYFKYATSSSGMILNEYGRKDETLENWTSLFTVRAYPHDEKILDIIKRYMKTRRQFLMMPAKIYKIPGSPANSPNNIIIVLFLADVQRRKMEYVIHRIFRKKGVGVLSYVYSQHFPLQKQVNVTRAMKLQNSRMKELWRLLVLPISKQKIKMLEKCIQ